MTDMSLEKLHSQEAEDPPLDVTLSSPSSSPRHGHSEATDFGIEGIRPSEAQSAVYDSKYGLSQVSDAGRFEEASKMYVCHLCDFRTAFRNSLLNHQAVHSDFRPWVCNVCEYAAKRKQDLKKHLHTIHGLMVESIMLKPVGLSGINSNVMSGSLSRGESAEDNSWDGNKTNKMSGLDPITPSSHFLQTVLDNGMSQNLADSHLPSASEILSLSIKQEKIESTAQKPLPGMSNFIHRSPSESDYDLPVSFPSTHRDDMIGHHQDAAKSSESWFHSDRIHPSTLDKNRPTKDCKPNLTQSRHVTESDLSYSLPSHTRKRPRGYHADNPSHPEISRDQSTPTLVKSSKISESDDHLPCSSSVGICQSKGSQTQACFMCQFCDIMFFQRAMYLMHAGLHSADNPWCCAVCGSCFTEKYSFTSHFINQH